jgi:hypothetical protein
MGSVRSACRRGAGAVASALLIGTISTGTGALEPAAAQANQRASCTEGGVRWTVQFDRFDTAWGPAVRVTGLSRTAGGTTTDAASLTWELRWDHHPSLYPPAAASPPAQPFESRRGQLTPTGVGAQVPGWFSPRLVTPDGACTVYLSPFDQAPPNSGWPRVAVLGDDLLGQLNDSNVNQFYDQGFVEARLAGLRIGTEIEGQTGRRFSDDGAADLLDRADSYLLDEYRGLLEHDVDGFVVALGVNDAAYIAAAPPAERTARRDAVYAKLAKLAAEIGQRTGCVQLVTMPESSPDPALADAAFQVNQFARFVGLGSPNDSGDLVDFAAAAASHRATDPEPWLAPDGVHLAGAGLDRYTDALVQAARRCAERVVGWGAPGTITGQLADETRLPSGLGVTTREVPGWGFPPGRMAYLPAVAADGSFFVSHMSQTLNAFQQTGETMSLSVLQPDEISFQDVRIRTSKGRDRLVSIRWEGMLPGDPPQPWASEPGRPAGMDLGDVTPIEDGTAMAFSGASPSFQFQDVARDGYFPSFGILTEGPSGWEVAGGVDAAGQPWTNQWTAIDLYNAATTPEERALADLACPLSEIHVFGAISVPGNRECNSFQEMVVLPHSGDIAITQYFGVPGTGEPVPGAWAPPGSGQVVVLKVDPSPTVPGKFDVKVRSVFRYPLVQDPAQPAGTIRHLWVAPLSVVADPTSAPDDERFAVMADTVYWGPRVDHDNNPQTVAIDHGHNAKGVVEFSYDEATGALQPVSAPIVTGAVNNQPHPLDGQTRMAGGNGWYDDQGNLYVDIAGTWVDSLGLAVYPKAANGRKISNGTCPFNGDLAGYVAAPPPGTSPRPTWGQVCAPEYLLRQPEQLAPTSIFGQDPRTGTIVGITAHDEVYAIDPSGSGSNMTFQVSNVTSTLPRHLADGAPLLSMGGFNFVDDSGRAWFVVAGRSDGSMVDTDSYVMSVDVARLLGREALPVGPATGDVAYLHAERSSTYTTTQVAGTVAAKDVESVAHVTPCWEVFAADWCDNPESQQHPSIGGAFALGRDAGGVRPGTSVDYRIAVPKDGTYRLSYQVRGRTTATEQIRLAVDGTTVGTTSVSQNAWHTVDAPAPFTLAAGLHTVTVSAPDGRHGWQLDWMRVTTT